RRGKVIHAEGEFEASKRLAEAGKVIASEPATLQLRYLQTLTEIASDKNSTIIFPIPIDLIQTLVRNVTGNGGDGNGNAPRQIPPAD
ncbi:MAG TPA: slipin family protein, partial [Dehalococcoidia bacterium]